MAIQDLKLGQSVDNLLKTANTNFKEIGDTLDNWSDTIESGGTKGIVFSTVDKMIECLNANTTEDGEELKLNIGDEIYIVEENAPDFWVAGINYNPVEGAKPESWELETPYGFYKYIIQVSKSKEIDLENYVTQEELETEIAEAGKVQDVRVNNSSVVVDKIAYIDIDEIQSEYIEISSGTADYWGTWDIDGVVYWALKLKDTDTQIEVFNELYESVVYQTIRQTANNTMYLCITTSTTEKNKTWYIRKIKGNAITTGGSGSGGGTKKYLHKLYVTTENIVSSREPINESAGLFRNIEIAINGYFFVISESSTPMTLFSSEENIWSTAFVNYYEEEVENLGEDNSQDEILNQNEYLFHIASVDVVDSSSIRINAYGTKTKTEFDYASLSNLVIVGEGVNVDVYDIPIIVGAEIKNEPASVSVTFTSYNYNISSDTVTEL